MVSIICSVRTTSVFQEVFVTSSGFEASQQEKRSIKRQGKRAVGRTSNYDWFSTFYFFEFMILTDNSAIV